MQNILITGANGHLGQAVVEHLHEKGHFIEAVTGHKDDRFSQYKNLRASSADLTNPEAAKSLVEAATSRHKKLHAGILLAGGFGMGNLADTDWNSIEKMLHLNFKTAYTVVQPLLEHFKKNDGGRIILVGARPALQASAGAGMAAYALSKGLILHLAELINAADNQVVCSVIVPSIIDTPPNRDSMPNADFEKWVPPEKIAESISYLLSDAGKMLRQPILKIYNES